MSLALSSSASECVETYARNFSRGSHPNADIEKRRANMKQSGEDLEHVAQLAAGDTSALRHLYERHGRALLRFSIAMCRSRQLAEDLVHDTFLNFMRAPQLFDPALGSVYGYLCGMLRHQVSRHYRRQKRWVEFDADDEACAPADEADGPADEIARSEITAVCRRAMLELPMLHREVIVLCDLEELPYATVAEILRCPIGTVRSRLHRARALLMLRLASLELIELEPSLPLAQEGLT
jgi:RNA polymerase sigma-70 factor (ECF subfamily)